MATRQELDETIALVEAAGGKMLGSVADVRDFGAVKAALDGGVEHFGRLDIVCANAGIATMAFRELTIEEDLEQWTDVLDVNLVGAFHTAKAAIPHLIAGDSGWVDRLHQFDSRPARIRRHAGRRTCATPPPSTASSV